MAKIGRNSPCRCGSGKKYKNCCSDSDRESQKTAVLPGRTRFEPGSYGGGGRPYHPSLMCYRETESGGWEEHYCLVKPNGIFESEEAATCMATEHLNEAFSKKKTTGNQVNIATVLRGHGYKNVEGYRVIKEEK